MVVDSVDCQAHTAHLRQAMVRHQVAMVHQLIRHVLLVWMLFDFLTITQFVLIKTLQILTHQLSHWLWPYSHPKPIIGRFMCSAQENNYHLWLWLIFVGTMNVHNCYMHANIGTYMRSLSIQSTNFMIMRQQESNIHFE